MEEVVKALIEERYLLAALLAVFIGMLITGKGLVTSRHMIEWKERANRYEEEKHEAELALRENTLQLERLVTVLETTNEIYENMTRGPDADRQ